MSKLGNRGSESLYFYTLSQCPRYTDPVMTPHNFLKRILLSVKEIIVITNKNHTRGVKIK